MATVIITGANRGLGLELTRQYLNDGWTVIAINRRSSPELDELRSRFPLTVLAADLTDDASLKGAVDAIDVSSVDVLINCAGTMGNRRFAEDGLEFQAFGTFDRDEWLRVFDINVCTPMALTEMLVDKLEAAENPRVVTFSSVLGSNAKNSFGNIYAYRASKAAVNSIMKSMGINLKPRGITAVAMHPGWVRTDMGGPSADLAPAESIAAVRDIISELTLDDAGKFLAYDGSEMPY